MNQLLPAGLILTLLVLGAGACADGRAPAPESAREPVPEADDAIDEPAPSERRKADGESRRTDEDVEGRRTRVTRVIDGDTVVTTKLGPVRLIGVDTPEEGRCYETAATRFTRERIGGQIVRYELGEERTDRYGRTLAYLWEAGRMHNLALVLEGYAAARPIPPNDRYANRFEAAERRARRRKEGRWGACERRSTPSLRPPRRRRSGGGLAAGHVR